MVRMHPVIGSPSGKASVARPRHVKAEYRLKRLPGDFSWELLDKLVRSFSTELSQPLFATFCGVARRRDPREYYGLDSTMGLQCISRWRWPMAGNPAVVHMICSFLRKNVDVPLVDETTRKHDCMTRVVQIDESLPLLAKPDWLRSPVYVRAKELIKALLGPVPTPENIAFHGRHGPGSTASIPFGERSAYFKYADFPYWCSPSSQSLLTYCITSDIRWASALEDAFRERYDIPKWRLLNRSLYLENLVRSECNFNVITSVPKDGRKDRPIAKEQTGNIYLQLAIGSIIRSRLLRRWRVDLNEQADVNRGFCLSSSQRKDLFTIDLSNASDTVSYALVKSLLPDDWFQLLCSVRSPWGILPSGDAIRYRKFSSMGNGYTFELETLIFLAICKAVSHVHGSPADDVFAVFGDDIIGPDYLYNTIANYLEYSGFQVNSEKSFSGSDRVRESCGVDALDGYNIRPVFMKGNPDNAMEMLGLRNRIRSWYLTHLGSMPEELDTWFLRTFDLMPPLGPDSSKETDGWWQDGDWPYGTRFQCLTGSTVEIPARDFRFRKLMHSLLSCTGEGGNFLVVQPGKRIKVKDRVKDWE